MDNPMPPGPLPRTDIALFFLLMMLAISLGYLVLGFLCMPVQFLMAVAFIAIAASDTYAMKFAKATLVFTLAFIILSVASIAIFYVFVLGSPAIGTAGASVNPALGLAALFAAPLSALGYMCFTVLLYGGYMALLAFLALKVFQKEPCPWF